MIRRPPRSTQSRSSAASDVYKRQVDLRIPQRKCHLTSRIDAPQLFGQFLYVLAGALELQGALSRRTLSGGYYRFLFALSSVHEQLRHFITSYSRPRSAIISSMRLFTSALMRFHSLVVLSLI